MAVNAKVVDNDGAELFNRNISSENVSDIASLTSQLKSLQKDVNEKLTEVINASKGERNSADPDFDDGDSSSDEEEGTNNYPVNGTPNKKAKNFA